MAWGEIFAFLLSAPIVGLAAALAFYKVNGRPFIYFLGAAFNFATKPTFYIWRRISETKKKEPEEERKEEKPIGMPKLTESRLKELAWTLDVPQKKQ